jgi:CheY-like chemotaxis protein
VKLSDSTVLLVDDEPELREIFEYWLQGSGCRKTLTAANGQEALAILTHTPVDLLLTDVRMPIMDGIAMMRRIAELDIRIPSIIFVSGFGDVDEKEMYALGVEAFRAKPVSRDELIGAMERALADRSELWMTPLEAIPKQSLFISARGIGELLGENRIRMGRGGFSASFSGPVSLGKVEFELHLESENIRLTGQGYVRWISRSEQAIGIEFAFLEETSRDWLLQEIARINPRGFIPSH